MATKAKRDDPNATWLSRRFGEHALADSTSKAAYEGFISEFGTRDKTTGKFRHNVGAPVCLATGLGAAALLGLSFTMEPIKSTTYSLAPIAADEQVDLATNYGFSYAGRNYFITNPGNDGYLLWEQRGENEYALIENREQAYFIIENFEEDLGRYVDALNDSDLELPDEAFLFIKPTVFSQAFTTNYNNLTWRQISDSESYNYLPATEGNIDSISVEYDILNAQLENISQHILDNGYDTESIATIERQTIEKTHERDNPHKIMGIIAGSLFAFFPTIGLMSGGLKATKGAAHANRRRKKKQQANKL